MRSLIDNTIIPINEADVSNYSGKLDIILPIINDMEEFQYRGHIDNKVVPIDEKLVLNYLPTLYEVLNITKNLNTNYIFIVNSDNKYIGTITQNSIFTTLQDIVNTAHQVSYIELQVPFYKHSLSELSMSFEYENIKIVQYNSKIDENDGEILHLFLVLSRPDISHMIEILKNKGYKIIQAPATTSLDDMLNQRLDNLMSYLTLN